MLALIMYITIEGPMTYKNRADRCIAQGTMTNSKHWSSHVFGIYPTHIKGSTGPFLIDVNNKKYFDFIGGLGTNLLGYGHPIVENEVQKYRYEGKSPSLPHILEVELAENLRECFPWIDRWKFLKTGTEACLAAIRISRAHNEKKLIYTDGYHGWSDPFVSITPPAKGIDFYHYVNDMGNIGTEQASGVIIEPVQTIDNKDRLVELKRIRNVTKSQNVNLIFDEVITGFRVKGLSIAKKYSLEPDLMVVGKAMANGYPLAAVGGTKDIMDNDYFVSSTYAGEIGSIAASKAVIKALREDPNYNIDHLINEGERFCEEFNTYAAELDIKIEGYGTRGVFTGNPHNIAVFMQEACKGGMIFGKSWFISFAHIEYMKDLINLCRDILVKMSRSMPPLIGQMPQSPFASKVRKQ